MVLTELERLALTETGHVILACVEGLGGSGKSRVIGGTSTIAASSKKCCSPPNEGRPAAEDHYESAERPADAADLMVAGN